MAKELTLTKTTAARTEKATLTFDEVKEMQRWIGRERLDCMMGWFIQAPKSKLELLEEQVNNLTKAIGDLSFEMNNKKDKWFKSAR